MDYSRTESEDGGTLPHPEEEPVALALEQLSLLPREQHEAWLLELDSTNPQLAQEVRSLARFVGQHDLLSHRASNFVLVCDEEQPQQFGPGIEFAGYRLTTLLGEGGHGMVWVGTKQDGTSVAIKILKSGLYSEAARKRFRSEVRILQQLDHPSITRYIDSGVTDAGIPYVILELIRGQDILTFSNENGLDRTARIQLIIQALQGLDAAHARGVVHRDIKPSNILVMGGRAQPVLRLIDFGIAKLTDDPSHATASLTITGQAMGTIHYMSPEQIGHGAKDLGRSSDLYSIGVVAYQLLTGHLPYDRQQLERSASEAICDSLPHLCRKWDSSFPQSVDSVLARALRKEPGLRFATAAEFAAALSGCLDGETPESIWTRRRYSAQHFVTRYWLPLSATLTLLVGLSIATAVSARWAMIAERDREAAEFGNYRSTLAGVSRAIDSGDLEGARSLLADAPPAQRGPEWNWLSSLATGARQIWSDEVAIRSIVPAESGWLLGLMSGELVGLSGTGQEHWRVHTGPSPISAIAVQAKQSDADSVILAGHADGTLTAVKQAAPDTTHWKVSLGEPVIGVASSEDVWIVATRSTLHRVGASGQIVHRSALQVEASAFCFDHETGMLFLGMTDGSVQSKVWDGIAWTDRWKQPPTTSTVASLVSSSGSGITEGSLWVSWLRGDVQEFRASDGQAAGSLLVPASKVLSLAFDPTSSTLALGGRAGNLWSLRSEDQTLHEFPRDHSGMTRVAAHGGVLASAGWDGTVRVRSLGGAKHRVDDPPSPLATISLDAHGVPHAAWRSSQDANVLVVRTENGPPTRLTLQSVITSLAPAQTGWILGMNDGSVWIVGHDSTLTQRLPPDGVPSMWVAESSVDTLWKVTRAGQCSLVQSNVARTAASSVARNVDQMEQRMLAGIASRPTPDDAVAIHDIEGNVRLVSSKSDRTVVRFGENVTSISSDRTRTRWAAISTARTSLLLATRSHQRVNRITFQQPATTSPYWLDASRRLIVGHADGTLSIIESQRAENLTSFQVCDAAILDLRLDDNGKLSALDDQGVLHSLDIE